MLHEGKAAIVRGGAASFLQDLIGAIRKPSSLPDLNSPLSLSAHRLCCTIKQTALSILLQPVASSMKRSHEDKVHLTQDRES